MPVVIGDLILNLGLDPSQYTAQLEAAKRQAQTAGSDIERMIKGGTQSLALSVKVDERPLTALNAHLDLKKQHFQAVQAYFDSNPLTPKVDLTQIKQAQAEIDKLLSKSAQVAVSLDLSSARAELVALKAEASKSVRSRVDFDLGSTPGAEGGQEKLSAAIDKLVSTLGASSKAPSLLDKAKQALIDNASGYAKQAISTQGNALLKKYVGTDAAGLAGKAIDIVSKPIKGVLDNEAFQAEISKATDLLGKRLKAVTGSVGDGIAAAIAEDGGNITVRLKNALTSAIKPSFKEGLAEFGKELQQSTANISGATKKALTKPERLAVQADVAVYQPPQPLKIPTQTPRYELIPTSAPAPDQTTASTIEASKRILAEASKNTQQATAIAPTAPDRAIAIAEQTAEALGRVRANVDKAIANLSPAARLGSKEGNQLANLKSQVAKLSVKVDALVRQTGTLGTGEGATATGESIGKGLGEGIKDSAASVRKSSQSLAHAAIKAVKDTLEIQSPSKVFLRIGLLAADGFNQGLGAIKGSQAVQGVERAIAQTKQAAQNASQSVQRGAGKALNIAGNVAADAFVQGTGSLAGLGTTVVAGPAAGLAVESGTKAAARYLVTPDKSQVLPKIAADVSGTLKSGILGATPSGAPLNLVAQGADALKNALKSAQESINVSNPVIGGFIGKLSGLGGAAKLAAGAFLAFPIAGAVIQTILPMLSQLEAVTLKAAIRLDNFKTALNFASGGSDKGAENLKFVRDTVDHLKIPLGAAEQGFVRLAAATRGSSAEGRTTKDVFTGIAQASTVLGLSTDETQGAIMALSQMAGKGVVQMEELRGQLGERIPGAFGIAARAMGQSEEQLNKFVESGQLTASEFLPKFAKQLQIEFGGSAVEASKNAQSAMYDLQNQTQKLNEAVGKLFQQGAMDWSNQLAGGIKFLVQNFDNLIAIATTVGGVIGVGIAQRLLNMAIAARGSGVMVKLLAQGISGLGSALLGALPAIAAFLGKFILIQAAFEAVRSTASLFQLSDLGKQFEGFGNQATENLKRIGAAADVAAGKVKKVAPPKPGSQSEGFDLTLGAGNALGLGTVKTDDVLNFTNQKLGTNIATVSDIQSQREAEQSDKFNTAVRDTVGAALDPTMLKKSLNDAAAIEKQMVDVGNQRSLEAAKVSPDKVKLEALNKQYLELSAKQQTVAAPAAEIQGALGAQKKNAMAALEAIDADKTKTDDQKEALKVPYQNAIAQIELAQKSVDKVTAGIKTSASAARNLGDEFAKINSKLGETQRAAERTLTKSTTGNIQAELKSFGGTDELAKEKAASANAEAEALRAKTLADSNQNALAQQRKLLEGQDVQTVLSGISQGSTGKSITLDSSIEDIDKAMKGLGDKDANKKGVLEQLKAYKEAGDKQLDLGKNAAQSQLGAKQAKQTEALAGVDKTVSDRTFQQSQALASDTLTVKQAQLKGGIVGDGGETEIRKSQIANSQQTVQLKEAELAKIKQLKDQGVIDAKTAADREQKIQGELSQEKIKLVELEVQQKLTYIQWEVDAGKRKTDLAVAGLDREAAAIKLYVNDLDNAGKRLQIQTELVKALADQRQAASKIKIEDASEKLEGAKRLQDEKTGKLERAAIEKQTGLTSSGVTGQDIAKLTADKLNEEAKADTDRANALLQQQSLLRQNLEIDLKRQEAAAKSAVLEAKKNELLSQQNVLSAKGELAKAKITGDANQIANAESAVQLAQQGVELAGQQTAMAQDNVGVVQELAAGQRQVIAIQQQTERTTLGAEINKNNRAREREIARVSDEQGLSNAPEVQAAIANLNGNGAPLPQFSPGGVPAANQIQPFNVPQSQPSIESPQFGSGFGGGGQAGSGAVGGEAVSVLREILGVLKSGSNKETTVNINQTQAGASMSEVLREVSNLNRPR